jgi:hypothetical protein
MRNDSLIKKAGWLLALGLCTSTAWAHHGGGTFDANKCFVFKGTVRQVAFVNPHAWIYVQVEKPAGASELWGFEFGGLAGLMRAGLKDTDFGKGTKVTVTAYANRQVEKHTASANKVLLADGRQAGGSEIAGTAPANAPPPAAGGPPGAGPAQPAANCPEYK